MRLVLLLLLVALAIVCLEAAETRGSRHVKVPRSSYSVSLPTVRQQRRRRRLTVGLPESKCKKGFCPPPPESKGDEEDTSDSGSIEQEPEDTVSETGTPDEEDTTDNGNDTEPKETDTPPKEAPEKDNDTQTAAASNEISSSESAASSPTMSTPAVVFLLLATVVVVMGTLLFALKLRRRRRHFSTELDKMDSWNASGTVDGTDLDLAHVDGDVDTVNTDLASARPFGINSEIPEDVEVVDNGTITSSKHRAVSLHLAKPRIQRFPNTVDL